MSFQCYKCFAPLEIVAGAVSRQEECLKCHAMIHVCRMCEHYDVSAYNQCRESSADRVVDKEKANFCDYFVLSAKNKSAQSTEDIWAKASSLFKK